jgi:hypothetical protein
VDTLVAGASPQVGAQPPLRSTTPIGPLAPILEAVKPGQGPVPREVLDRAQELLDKGDRGGAYLTLYRELGNEQILIQTQITTYTGIWGSGALTGNNAARLDAGSRYNTRLDEFSVEIAQATIDAVRQDLEAGGTGRLTDDQFQTADRHVWARKGMPELFPGNIQFFDFWNHAKGDRGAAILAKSNLNLAVAALRSLVPNTSFLGLNHDLRNVSHYIGKRPAEFADNPNYEIHGTSQNRFITVIDKRTGFVEAFWDNKPRCGLLPMPQIKNEPIRPDSPEYRRRQELYQVLGANRHAPSPATAPEPSQPQPSPNRQTLWVEAVE